MALVILPLVDLQNVSAKSLQDKLFIIEKNFRSISETLFYSGGTLYIQNDPEAEAQGDINLGGSTLIVSAGAAAVLVQGDLLPLTDSAWNIGSASLKWRNVFFSGTFEADGVATIGGRLNIGGAVDTVNYKVNVLNGYFATTNSFGYRSFGVGGPSAVAAGNTEYIEYYHDGAGSNGATVNVAKTGTGSLRQFNLRMGGTAKVVVTVAGSVLVGDTAVYSTGIGLGVKLDDGVGSGEHFIAEFYRTNGGTAQLLIGYRANGATVTGQLIRSGNSLPLFIGTSSANQAICIFNGGDVTIGGTVDNGFKLEVTGTVNITGLFTGVKGVFTSDFTLGASSLVAGAALALAAGTGALTMAPASFTVTPAIALNGGLTFAGGGTNLNHHEEGTFTFTATGMTTSPTGTAKFIRTGKKVLLMIPSISGTSNTTRLTYTGLPASLQPVSSQTMPIGWVQNNSADSTAGSVTITSTGTITFNLNNNPIGWTNANGKGLPDNAPVEYLLT